MRNDISTIIRERRTIREVVEKNISKDTIDEILQTASYAPFHSSKEPWRVYTVFGKKQHTEYTRHVIDSYDRLRIWDKFEQEKVQEMRRNQQEYFEKIPVTLLVTCVVQKNEKADFESLLATAAFIQNIQLLAWEQQLGVTWRTTPNIHDQEFLEALKIPENQQIVGTLHFTHLQEKVPKVKPRSELAAWTQTLFEREVVS